MSLYIGYYWGATLSARKFLDEDEIEAFYNGEESPLLKELESNKIELTSGEDEAIFMIGQKLNNSNYYECYYSGRIAQFDANQFLNFDKNKAQELVLEKLNTFNEILAKHGKETIEDINKVTLRFFTHTVS